MGSLFKKGSALILAIALSSGQIGASLSFADESKEKNNYPILDKYVKSKKIDFKIDDKLKKEDRKVRAIVELDKSLENKAEEEIKKIPGVSIQYRYNSLLNGISIDIPNESVEKLLSIEGVTNVKKSEKLIPQTYNAKEITKVIEAKAKYSNKYGLDGRGMLIATLDSGVDINHPDMRIDPEAEKDMKIKDIKAPFTKKVPFGFNYFKADHSILKDDVSKPHGMHIAGILAGNSPKKDGFKGIAPNAQLLVYKVITYDRKGPNASPYEIEYIGEDAQYHAMEDAVSKGADVISLSIGSFGSGREDDIWNSVVQKCYDKGVIVVSAMGNRAAANSKSSYENFPDSEYDRKDLSTGVSVAVNSNSIGAGSTRNTGMRLPSVDIGKEKYAYSDLSRFNSKSGSYEGDIKKGSTKVAKQIPDNEFSKEFIYVGKGMDNDDLPPSKVNGKIIVADRGGEDIRVKALRFLGKGAKGFIMINGATDTSDVDTPDQPILGFNHLSIHNGWAISISKNSGEKLKKQIEKNKELTMKFDEVPRMVRYLKQNLISGFSSWGPSYDLEMKPDMVAPGENILSLGNGDGYTTQSGTSMASPHIAGISTLMLSKTKNIDDPNVKKMNLADVTRVMMMNTSEVLLDYDAQKGKTILPYSPRLQGAGLINMESALDTDVMITYNGKKGAVSLKEIGDKTSFRLKIINFSDKKRSFNVEPMEVLTSGVRDADKGVKATTSKVIEGASISGDSFVTIKPHSTAYVEFILDATPANDQFVEGYIKFLPADEDGQPILSVPYLGFKGDWAKENILDKPQWEEGSITKLSKLHKFLHNDDHDGDIVFEQLGKKKPGTDIDDPDTYMINSVRGGIQDYKNTVKGVAPSVTFLREAKDFDVSVVKDKSVDSKALRTLEVGHYPDRYVENAYRESGSYYMDQYRKAMGTAMWDGGLYDATKTGSWESNWLKAAEEGQYFIRIRARKSSEKPWEAIYMPVKVDNHNPTVFYNHSIGHSKVEVDIKDNEGIEYAGATINGKDVHMHEIEKGKYEISLPEDDSEKVVRVEAMDYAGNPVSKELKINGKAKEADIQENSHDKDKKDAHSWGDEDEEDQRGNKFDPRNIEFGNGVMANQGIAQKQSNNYDVEDLNNPKFRIGFAYIPQGLKVEVENINTHYNYVNKLQDQYKPLDVKTFEGDDDSAEEWIRVADGDNYLRVKVTDKDGKVVYFNKYTLFVDLHSPVGLFSNNISLDKDDEDDPGYDGTGSTHYGRVYVNSDEGEISGTVSDNLDKYLIKVNGDVVDLVGLQGHFGPEHNTRNFKYKFKAVDGEYLHMVLQDIYGNDKRYELKIIKDVVAPNVTIENESSLGPDSKLEYSVTENIRDKAKDENVKTLITVNGIEYEYNKKLSEYDVKGKEGNYLIKIVSVDLAGNATEVIKKVEKTPGILEGKIKDYPLKKDSYVESELDNVENLFDLDNNVKAKINNKKLEKGMAKVEVAFTDEFGNSKNKEYEVKLRDVDEIVMKYDESLNRELLKSEFDINEKNIFNKLFNLDDGADFTIKNKIELKKAGEKTFKVRFEKGDKYFERVYKITIKKSDNKDPKKPNPDDPGKKDPEKPNPDDPGKEDPEKPNPDDPGKKDPDKEPIDKSELEKSISKAKEEMNNVKYKRASKAVKEKFDKKLKEAIDVMDRKELTQKDVDNAKDELNIAVADLDGKNTYTPSGRGGSYVSHTNKEEKDDNSTQTQNQEDMVMTPFDSLEKLLNNEKVSRVAGINRRMTAVEISKRMYNRADNVVLVEEKSQADALASALFAKQKKAPILLTSKDKICSDTLNEIKRLKAKKVYIVGGENSVTYKVKKSIEDLGIKVERISGKNRYETSKKIIENLSNHDRENIFIVNGNTQVDALTISPVSAAKEVPVILTDGNEIGQESLNVIGKYKNSMIVGGESSVSQKIQKQLNAKRISGKDRFDTSLAIKKMYFRDSDEIFIANGVDYVDSLTGSVYAAKNNSPVMLVKKDKISKGVLDSVNKAKRIVILGGNSSIK